MLPARAVSPPQSPLKEPLARGWGANRGQGEKIRKKKRRQDTIRQASQKKRKWDRQKKTPRQFFSVIFWRHKPLKALKKFFPALAVA
jgi:hypothetical protein